jgi:hypothetical protein
MLKRNGAKRGDLDRWALVLQLKTDIYDQKKEFDDENENGTFCTHDSVFASFWLFPYA